MRATTQAISELTFAGGEVRIVREGDRLAFVHYRDGSVVGGFDIVVSSLATLENPDGLLAGRLTELASR